MNPFQYTKAKDARDAIRSVAADVNTDFIAGGTNKIDLLRHYVELNDKLVDINALPLSGVQVMNSPQGVGLRIGALARMSDVASHPAVVQHFPVISQALLLAASPQLRNMASIGGNILQRTRCPYFRETAFTECNKRIPGSGCAAIKGDNREQAVLGTSDACIALHASDLTHALTALDSIVVIQGPRGERRVPFVDFHVVPGNTPWIETVLQHGELITAIEVPALSFSSKSLYLKVRDRTSYAFALASAAVALDIVGGQVRDARVALGGVGTKPWRSPQAEAALKGQPATEATFQAAARAAVQGARPQADNAFKVDLVQRTLVRALNEVANGSTNSTLMSHSNNTNGNLPGGSIPAPAGGGA